MNAAQEACIKARDELIEAYKDRLVIAEQEIASLKRTLKTIRDEAEAGVGL